MGKAPAGAQLTSKAAHLCQHSIILASAPDMNMYSQDAGLCPRQIDEGVNVPMFETNVRNSQVGPFGGNLVVSMRPYHAHQIGMVDAITSRYPGAHGGPIHWGDPAALGLTMEQLMQPSWGDRVSIQPGEVPVFWACGVTPQAALQEAKLPLAITHAPGHMFICDVLDRELEVQRASGEGSAL